MKYKTKFYNLTLIIPKLKCNFNKNIYNTIIHHIYLKVKNLNGRGNYTGVITFKNYIIYIYIYEKKSWYYFFRTNESK